MLDLYIKTLYSVSGYVRHIFGLHCFVDADDDGNFDAMCAPPRAMGFYF